MPKPVGRKECCILFLLSEGAVVVDSEAAAAESVGFVVGGARLHQVGAAESMSFAAVVMEIVAAG